VNRPPSNRYEPRLGLFDPSSYPWLLQSVSKTLAHPLHAVMRALRKRTQGNAGPLLRSLIRLKRSKLAGTTFIAVTGSCGKSTTVALADAMLSPAGKCISPSMGKTVRTIDWAWTLVVDTIIDADKTTSFCILETHAPSPGIIASSLNLLRPQIGVVTNIGSDHRSNYRSLEATAQEKGLLVESLPPNGVAILNIDDPHVAGMRGRARATVLTFGRSEEASTSGGNSRKIWIPSQSQKIILYQRLMVAGAPGFEPGMTGPKPVALPLGHAPIPVSVMGPFSGCLALEPPANTLLIW
jgi:UDP-N-acetylmuramoylalanine-D-glutamate ligase